MRISDWSSDVCSSDLEDTKARKIEICERAYKLLTGIGFPPEDIIFDPNIFAVATGIEEHNNYGVDFIEACKEIKARLPRSEEHTSELQSLMRISYADFYLKTKICTIKHTTNTYT